MWAVLRFIRRSTVLLGVGLVGGTVTAAGVVMLVTPGPGLLVIIAGLAILATQFAWAERALDKVKSRARSARDNAALRRFDRRAAAAAAAEPDPPTAPELAAVPDPPSATDQPSVGDQQSVVGNGSEPVADHVDIHMADTTDHDSHATG